jgi:uncharacterized protein DUF4864
MQSLLRALLLSFAPLFVWAQPSVTTADARAVREVIKAQLDAFQKDDAPRAFSYATAGIREAFRTPESFLEMVRTSYPAVYRPKTVKFEAPQLIDDVLVQPVRLTDADGRAWMAIYRWSVSRMARGASTAANWLDWRGKKPEGGRASRPTSPQDGSWAAPNFRFHTSEVLPEVCLHYRTVGAPTGEPVLVLHGTACGTCAS